MRINPCPPFRVQKILEQVVGTKTLWKAGNKRDATGRCWWEACWVISGRCWGVCAPLPPPSPPPPPLAPPAPPPLALQPPCTFHLGLACQNSKPEYAAFIVEYI